jgi:Restriction endonuclease
MPSPVRPLLRTLPFDQLEWPAFEEAVRDLVRRDPAFRNVQAFGVPGDAQGGIDIRADRDDGHIGIQVKRREDFGGAAVRDAIAATRYLAQHFIIALSRTATAGARTEIDKHPSWSLWDQVDLSDRVRALAQGEAVDYIQRHFHPSWAETFLGSPHTPQTPTDFDERKFALEGADFDEVRMTDSANTARYLVAITPGRYDGERLTLSECRQIMQTARVSVMGWAMPFYGNNVTVGPGYIFEKVDFKAVAHHVEEWRLYRSGQFVHRSIPFERLKPDFDVSARALAEWNPHGGAKRTAEARGFLSFVALIYFVTQAYLFARSLLLHFPDDDEASIYVGLRDVEHFALGTDDAALRLSSFYRTELADPHHAVHLTRRELIQDPVSACRTALEAILEQFNWDPARARATIESYQRSFLARTEWRDR